MEAVERDNANNYPEVERSGLGALYCLGGEDYRRLSSHSIDLLPRLARERTRGLHPRLRRGTSLLLLRRWLGILGVGLQRGTSHMKLMDSRADLVRALLEPATHLADL